MTRREFVAQRARLVERGIVAAADEAAVALEAGKLVGERGGKLGGQRRVGLAQRAAAACNLGRQCRDASRAVPPAPPPP